MKKILLIATGGTIASKPTVTGLSPQISSEEILACVGEAGSICEIDALQLYNLDSTNMCSTHWLGIAKCVREHYSAYDGFVITHGTDTMAYTAAALTYLVQQSPKPIVLTGSQKSIYEADSDARTNLLDAFIYAADEHACGVHIVFDGKVILGTRAKKTRTKSYNAFSSIDFPEAAIIRDKRLIYYIEEKTPDMLVQFFDSLNPRVFVLKLLPGIDSSIFEYLREHYDALIIESFGVGGIPCYDDESFICAIRDWTGSGKTLVMTTQVAHEGSDMEVYAVGQSVKQKYSLIEAYDMTLEAIAAKLMWILALTTEPSQIRELFYRSISRDIL